MKKLEALSALRGKYPILEPGHVWLVGAGPGDPGLLTLDAVAGLAQADIILHDALIDRRVLALADADARLEYVGKRGGRPSMPQAEITNRLVELARAGLRVLRLKGGDPCIFGRGGEEAIALASAGIPYRIVSGVTAGLAALAAASIPATIRGVNQALIFAAGHVGVEDGLDWQALVRTGQPIVIYMALRNIQHIADALARGGLPPQTPVAIIIAATMAQERVVISSLGRLLDDAMAIEPGLPGLVVIGDIVRMRDRLLQLADEFEVTR